jgi:hypothetical protein
MILLTDFGHSMMHSFAKFCFDFLQLRPLTFETFIQYNLPV